MQEKINPVGLFATSPRLPFPIRSADLWNIVCVLTLMVYAVGLFTDIMEPDAGLYAQISMEMFDRGDYLSIYYKGGDWLDKPHFPFWMSALSYHIFGVNAFAYKLPGVLFVLLGGWYTYCFAKRYYSPLHAWLSVLVLLTAQHIIISNADVRAEPFLTGLMIMGLYHFARLTDLRCQGQPWNWGDALLGSLALACLMMTKGMFTIIPIVTGVGLALLYRRRLDVLADWRWLAVAVFALIFIFPAIYGYYRQFDLHPEKTVFGRQGVSGVEFFLWTSQWGRFTNTGPIIGKGDPFYFVHTLIWAFLPWSFAAFYALYHKTRQLFRRREMGAQAGKATLSSGPGEWYTYFAFVPLFLIFSASKFQLSFYLNPLFPVLAILTVAVLLGRGIRPLNPIAHIQRVLCYLLIIALCLLHYYFLGRWPEADTLLVLIVGAGLGFYLFNCRTGYLKKIFFATPLVCLSVNYYLNREFYPELLGYQAESQAAYYIQAEGINPDSVVHLGHIQSISDVILRRTTPILLLDDMEPGDIRRKYVFTTPEGRVRIDSLGLSYSVINEFDDFHVTRLTGRFINRDTRQQELDKKLLLKVED